jgi:hypothetical protein
MRSPCCLCVSVSLSDHEQLHQSSWNLVWASWHLSPSQRRASVCVSVCVASIVVRQRLSIHVPGATNTWNKELSDTSFSMRSVPYQMRVCGYVYSPSLLGNGSVNTFPWQRRIVWGVVYYAQVNPNKETSNNDVWMNGWYLQSKYSI